MAESSGGGSNLLVADEGVPDVLLHLARGEPIEFAGNRVVVPAATSLGTAVLACAKRNLGGMEGLVGVPGTLGGALRMNAGSYGTEMAGVARAVTLFKGDTRQVETVIADQVGFGYRHTESFFPRSRALRAITLELLDCPQSEVLERVKGYNRKRRAAQPLAGRKRRLHVQESPRTFRGQDDCLSRIERNAARRGGSVRTARESHR